MWFLRRPNIPLAILILITIPILFIILIGPENRGSSGSGRLSWWHRDFRISTMVSATVSMADSLTVSTAGPLTVSMDMADSALVSLLGAGVADIGNWREDALCKPTTDIYQEQNL